MGVDQFHTIEYLSVYRLPFLQSYGLIGKVAIKKLPAELCLEIGMVYPLQTRSNDQVWPENFGGVNKAPAVDLVSGVYRGVQEDDE
jgi:hypothetical protein